MIARGGEREGERERRDAKDDENKWKDRKGSTGAVAFIYPPRSA